jgi:hypothetical protein
MPRTRDAGPSALQPRYGRIGAALTAAAVTVLAVLGAVGVLPTGPQAAYASSPAPDGPSDAASEGLRAGLRLSESGSLPDRETGAPLARSESRPRPATVALPDGSGQGRRIVFDVSAQRVWLVDADDRVERTYLVSGSLTDNLDPGSYDVYSKSRYAVGVDDSGVMQYMVRFAHGDHAAIGFHDIPALNGRFVQTRAQLGTPRSHGCVRQWRPDARALWRFAGVGTPVVVLA